MQLTSLVDEHLECVVARDGRKKIITVGGIKGVIRRKLSEGKRDEMSRELRV